MSDREDDVDEGLFDEEAQDQNEEQITNNNNNNDDGEEDEEDDIFGEEEDNNNSQPASSSQKMEEEEQFGHPLIEVTIPRYPPSHTPDKESSAYFTRVPSFLTLDPHPFDGEKFLKEQQDVAASQTTSESERTRLKLQNENTIRWKYSRDNEGSMIKQSNARFVKWDDGTMSLQLGNEIFDINTKQYQDAFLALSHPKNELLQTSSVLDYTMSLVPTSTSSHTHKRLTQELAKRQLKSAGSVGNFATTDDPEKVKREAEKAEEINIKARRKLEAKRRQLEEREGGYGGGHSRSSAGNAGRSYEDGSVAGRADSYEEDDFVVEDEDEDDERAQRLHNLKKRGNDAYKKRRNDEGSEDEIEDADELEDEEEEEEEEEEEQEEEEQEAEGEKESSKNSNKRRRIIDDDDDD